MIDLHRMIDHQIDRHQRFDTLGIAAELARRAAHRGEIGERGKAGEVLQHDARDDERNLFAARRVRLPRGELAHVLLAHALAVAVPEQRFEHDAHADRQARYLAEAGGFERGERIVLAGLAGGELELLQRVEQIVRHKVLQKLSHRVTEITEV